LFLHAWSESGLQTCEVCRHIYSSHSLHARADSFNAYIWHVRHGSSQARLKRHAVWYRANRTRSISNCAFIPSKLQMLKCSRDLSDISVLRNKPIRYIGFVKTKRLTDIAKIKNDTQHCIELRPSNDSK
jgi:hypothetical protein